MWKILISIQLKNCLYLFFALLNTKSIFLGSESKSEIYHNHHSKPINFWFLNLTFCTLKIIPVWIVQEFSIAVTEVKFGHFGLAIILLPQVMILCLEKYLEKYPTNFSISHPSLTPQTPNHYHPTHEFWWVSWKNGLTMRW